MNAIEARKQRQGAKHKSLSTRLRESGDMARRIDTYVDELHLEQQFIDAMQAQNITGAELARRTKSKPAAISRDLAGGLSSAKLGRVRQMAAAVGYDVITMLVPRDPGERRKTIAKVSRELTRGIK
ncbi:MAG TPA: hypothetical protein VNF68_14650 [Candidatus Baltobacteraceae bacterium]|nr:hypothetical protein [Candidatus Baltobacteraceae bacterium]